MNIAKKFKNWRSARAASNKLARLSGHELNDLGFKRHIAATDAIRFI